jgi:hypothetical protein
MLESVVNSLAKIKKKLFVVEMENQLILLLGNDQYQNKGGYKYLVDQVKLLLGKGILEPVKSQKYNGRIPALYKMYRVVTETPEWVKKEILLFKHIDTSYYINNPSKYPQDQKYLWMLERFRNENTISEEVSVNERSYQIFKDEKFIISPQGRKILQRTKEGPNTLKYYLTYEPLFIFPIQAKPTLNSVLIIENKDTFRTLFKYLPFNNKLEELIIDGLCWGEGKKILKSFDFVKEIPFIDLNKTTFYYAGDIDPEGISIAMSLITRYSYAKVKIMVPLYKWLIDKEWENPPKIKTENQQCTENDMLNFLSLFDSATAHKIKSLLASGHYVPQEALASHELVGRTVNERYT